MYVSFIVLGTKLCYGLLDTADNSHSLHTYNIMSCIQHTNIHTWSIFAGGEVTRLVIINFPKEGPHQASKQRLLCICIIHVCNVHVECTVLKMFSIDIVLGCTRYEET